MRRVADVAIDGERVVGRQVRATSRARCTASYSSSGEATVGFEDRLQDADGGAQPEVGPVEQGPVAGEVDAAAAGSTSGARGSRSSSARIGSRPRAQVAK